MSPQLLAVTAAIYAWVAYDYGKADRWGMGAAFVCYAIANLGFAWDALRAAKG
ncbi:hypothetical protein ACT80S_18595 [Ramlibacter sp. MAHUQ-53]|uniref:hypothetical protein n=1 Tax=unclassified Ramlibacter TaxID=2617605 RepID=UPI00363FE06A